MVDKRFICFDFLKHPNNHVLHIHYTNKMKYLNIRAKRISRDSRHNNILQYYMHLYIVLLL